MVSSSIKQFKIFGSIIGFISVNMMHNLARFKVSPKFLFHNKTVNINISSFITKWVIRIKLTNISIAHLCYSSIPIWIFCSSYKNQFFAFSPRNMTFFERRNWDMSFFKLICWRNMSTFHTNSKTFLRAVFCFYNTKFSNIKFFFAYLTSYFYRASFPTRRFVAMSGFAMTRFGAIFSRIFSILMNIKHVTASLANNGNSFSILATNFFTHISSLLKRALFGGLSKTVKSLHLLRAQIMDTKILPLISTYIIPQNMGVSI